MEMNDLISYLKKHPEDKYNRAALAFMYDYIDCKETLSSLREENVNLKHKTSKQLRGIIYEKI